MNVNGVNLECRWTGENVGDGPVIVLLHEGLGSVALWKDFPERLAQACGLKVFAYSRQGYGASDPAPLPRQLDYMHQEGELWLGAVLRAAGIDRPILFGHSDGASIALIYAAAHPDSVTGLVLEAPHVFVEEITVRNIARAKTVYETTDLPHKLARYHSDADNAFWGWNDIWLDPRFTDWTIVDRLGAIQCPILLIQGQEDEYGTRAQLDAIADATGQAEILLLEACGHSPHRDQTEAVLQATEDFIEALTLKPLPAE
jgi:pimeloyl-ACP methyl ester carboxylesterase